MSDLSGSYKIKKWIYDNCKLGQKINNQTIFDALPDLSRSTVSSTIWALGRKTDLLKEGPIDPKTKMKTYYVQKAMLESAPAKTKASQGRKRDKKPEIEEPEAQQLEIDPHIIDEVNQLKDIVLDAAMRLQRLSVQLEFA